MTFEAKVPLGTGASILNVSLSDSFSTFSMRRERYGRRTAVRFWDGTRDSATPVCAPYRCPSFDILAGCLEK